VKRNIEIKARMHDRAGVLAALVALGARDAGSEVQEDRFWRVADGARLKLRQSSRDGAALLAYRRADTAQLRVSAYERVPVAGAEVAALVRALDAVLEPAGTVIKERHLWFVDNVRVHLDHVQGLGEFLELEAMVDDAHPEAACHAAALALLRRFRIADADRVAVAYVDLLAAGALTARPGPLYHAQP
jgi:predicted adenylyl cyclase CyaB